MIQNWFRVFHQYGNVKPEYVNLGRDSWVSPMLDWHNYCDMKDNLGLNGKHHTYYISSGGSY